MGKIGFCRLMKSKKGWKDNKNLNKAVSGQKSLTTYRKRSRLHHVFISRRCASGDYSTVLCTKNCGSKMSLHTSIPSCTSQDFFYARTLQSLGKNESHKLTNSIVRKSSPAKRESWKTVLLFLYQAEFLFCKCRGLWSTLLKQNLLVGVNLLLRQYELCFLINILECVCPNI